MEKEQPTPKKSRKESVAAKLEALGDGPRRSQAALVAESLESIEQAIKRGIPMTRVWEKLQEEGFTLTFRSFESALYRLRKRKAARGPASSPLAPKTEAKPTIPITQPNPKEPPPAQSEEEDEETRAIQEYKKSISHLSPVQQGKKIADFVEKLQENKMLPSTRRWLDNKK